MADQQGGAAAAEVEQGQRYFCYQCNKEVAVEGSQGGMACTECQGGFLEAIATVSPEFHPRQSAAQAGVPIDEALERMYPDQLAQMVQALMTITRDFGPQEDDPFSPPHLGQGQQLEAGEGEADGTVLDHPDTQEHEHSDEGESDSESGGLRLELEPLDGNDEDDEWEEAEEEERVALAAEGSDEAHRDEEHRTGALTGYVRDLIQHLLNQNIEIRLELPDTFIGNPGDYLDARGFEQFLQHLADNDTSNKGAPPASKSVVDALKVVKITQTTIDNGEAVCAVCKDPLSLDEPAKQLPCLHVYHPDCILPWLSARNSCPVCRYELPTDDPDYEEQKKSRRAFNSSGGSPDDDTSSGSGETGQDSGGSSMSGSGDVCREESTGTQADADAEADAESENENENLDVQHGSSEPETKVEAESAEVDGEPENTHKELEEHGEPENSHEKEKLEEHGQSGSVSRRLLFAVGPVVSVLGLIVAGHYVGLLDGFQARVFGQLLGRAGV